ncbi:MAG: DUF5715 family protein [Candidatus Saccharibacteria bacterium]
MLQKLIHFLRRDILVLRLPKTLLISSIRLDEKHKREVLAENAIERTWHHKTAPFTSPDQILAAFATKRLAQVVPTADLLPIRRLRNPQLIATYPSYLTTEAHALLLEIGSLWRQAASAAGFDERIRIAITSLVRTKAYQNTLVKAGKLADPDSAHTRGEAFDLDASGYYIDETPINPRTTMQADFQKAFKELGADVFTDTFGDFSLYQPKVHEILKEVLVDMQTAGKLHFVHEFPGTGNDVFHVCRNPEYKA